MRKTGDRWAFLLALAVLASAISPSLAGAQGPQASIDPPLEAAMQSLAPGQRLSVIVTLREQANLKAYSAPGLKKAERQSGVIRTLKGLAERSQKDLLANLYGPKYAGQVVDVQPFWIFNGISLKADAEVIRSLAHLSDVGSIRLSQIVQLEPTQLPEAPPIQNLTQIHAPDLWTMGFKGQGIVVANVDTGVDVTHPDLQARYRGGTNSWFDATGKSSGIPLDENGHGTQTMGVMVAGDASGQSLGVAPGAQWIAARIFAPGVTTDETVVHPAFQWILDPDGDPNTPDAPDIVNNSWTSTSSGCILTFQPDINALLAAGIVPVFAAGNYGPNSDTSRYPANNPGAFPVGAVDGSDQIWVGSQYASSRGPSSCLGYTGVYPRVTAPGVSIHTTTSTTVYPYANYTNATGTSLAAPHVAGALALLLSAGGGLSPEAQEAALMNSALDLGAPGLDNTYGYGRIDVLTAYKYLKNPGVPSNIYLPIVLLNRPVLWLLYMPWIGK